MGIQQFHFSFKIDAKDLFEYIAERNVGVSIDAYGTTPKQPKKHKELAAPSPMLALAPPHRKGKPAIQASIMAFVLLHREGVPTAGLRALLVQIGHSENSLSNQVWSLKQKGLLKSAGPHGSVKYFPTNKAIKIAEAAHAQENA